jgi:hypothetical protein
MDPELVACLAGTRVQFLSDIVRWIKTHNSPPVCWVNGLAGTGKSTVARSICEAMAAEGLLAASFFISRRSADRRDSRRVIPSLVYQMALWSDPIRSAVAAAIRKAPDIAERVIAEQATELMAVALQSVTISRSPMVIVIDALDECADESAANFKFLIPSLVRALQQLQVSIKLFITSRNEAPIERMFEQLNKQREGQQQVARLHDIERVIVQGDIHRFLDYSFDAIASEHELTDWPSQKNVSILLDHSGVLFVYAATVVRFIGDADFNPMVRLEEILSASHAPQADGSSPYGYLDNLYHDILTAAIESSGGGALALITRLKIIAGSILLLEEQLSEQTLVALLGLDAVEARKTLRRLSSLLLITPHEPIRIFHPSLPDYLLDRCTDPKLRIYRSGGHGTLAHRCLLVMNKLLRRDICNLRDPSLFNREIPDLAFRIEQNIPLELQYACKYWIQHLISSTESSMVIEGVLFQFCNEHILHWLEVLSVLEGLAAAPRLLPQAIRWCKVCFCF